MQLQYPPLAALLEDAISFECIYTAVPGLLSLRWHGEQAHHGDQNREIA
jgi:hypothetical protein